MLYSMDEKVVLNKVWNHETTVWYKCAHCGTKYKCAHCGTKYESFHTLPEHRCGEPLWEGSAKTANDEMIYFLFSFKFPPHRSLRNHWFSGKYISFCSIFARKSEYHGPRPLDNFILIIALGGTDVKNFVFARPVLIEICQKKSESCGASLLFPLLGLVALKTRTFTPWTLGPSPPL